MRFDKSRIKVFTITIVMWLVACAGVNAWTISSYLANPQDGDLYAHTLGYQFVVFAIFRLPVWLLGLVVILAVEFALFSSHPNTAGA